MSSPAVEVLQEIAEEMARTDTNLDEPEAGDYAMDIIRRLDAAYSLGLTDDTTGEKS